jgi:SAM-dependent methyltransferase
VLNKIKKLFMKKEKIGEMRIPTDELQKEYETLENQEQSDQITDEQVIDDQIDLNENEKAELTNNIDYLEYSAEVVGYENRETQWSAYRAIFNYIDHQDSVLDFGCGRGDFERFCQTEFDIKIDYLGIDMNQQLIEAGKKAYDNEVNLQCVDWFELDKNVKKDWCINIGSNNLRYDADTVKTDQQYLISTIDKMIEHANKGVVMLLASDRINIDDGLISWNPGNILNEVLKSHPNVALDHSLSNEVFVLIIYKNEN